MFTDICCPVAKWFGIDSLVSACTLCWYRLKIQATIQTFTRVLIWNFIWFVRYHCGNSLPRQWVMFDCKLKLFHSMLVSLILNSNRSATFCAFERGEKNEFIYLKGWMWTNARVLCVKCYTLYRVENTKYLNAYDVFRLVVTQL